MYAHGRFKNRAILPNVMTMVIIEDLTEISITHVFVAILFPRMGAIGCSKQLKN